MKKPVVLLLFIQAVSYRQYVTFVEEIDVACVPLLQGNKQPCPVQLRCQTTNPTLQSSRHTPEGVPVAICTLPEKCNKKCSLFIQFLKKLNKHYISLSNVNLAIITVIK